MDGTEKEATEVVVVVAGTLNLAAAVERMEMELRIEKEENRCYLLEWHAQRRRLGQGCIGLGIKVMLLTALKSYGHNNGMLDSCTR